MELVIISGRSGSGKSTALHQLEDLGYYCVDNLPAALLPTLILQLEREQYSAFKGIAVCLDARNSDDDLHQIHPVLKALPDTINSEVIFLDASNDILIKRFSETRRRHPLTSDQRSLAEAIANESVLLEELAQQADLTIDTSRLTLYDLRAMISGRLGGESREGLSLLVESFGFKRGVPPDADLVFDARLLPNPHWVTHLRAKNRPRYGGRSFFRAAAHHRYFYYANSGFSTVLVARISTVTAQLYDCCHWLYRRTASLGLCCRADI